MDVYLEGVVCPSVVEVVTEAGDHLRKGSCVLTKIVGIHIFLLIILLLIIIIILVIIVIPVIIVIIVIIVAIVIIFIIILIGIIIKVVIIPMILDMFFGRLGLGGSLGGNTSWVIFS